MDTELWLWGRRKCRPPSCCVTTLLHDPTCGEAAGCYGWPRPAPGWRELVMPFDGVTSSAVEPNHNLKLEGVYICKWVCLLTFLVFTNPERRFKSKKKERAGIDQSWLGCSLCPQNTSAYALSFYITYMPCPFTSRIYANRTAQHRIPALVKMRS
jgi:hypothetical protein